MKKNFFVLAILPRIVYYNHVPSTLYILFYKLVKKFDKKKILDLLLNNAMYIIIALVVIYVAIKRPLFLGVASIINILSLTAAKLPIALGIAGCIVLAGTDISAGRVVGLSSVITASLLTTTSKIWPQF